MLSICDVVLNHTANETPWLRDHPEAAHNARDGAHLRPAALLDAALARLTRAVALGRLAPRVPSVVSSPEHIEVPSPVPPAPSPRLPHLSRAHSRPCTGAAGGAGRAGAAAAATARAVPVRRGRRGASLLPGRAQQVGGAPGGGRGRGVTKVTSGPCRVPPPPGAERPELPALRLTPDPLRRRLRAAVDPELALQLFNARRDAADEEARVRLCAADLRRALDALNAAAAAELHDHLRHALDNCVAGMRYVPFPALPRRTPARPRDAKLTRPRLRRYFRLQADGPKIAEVSTRHPLVPR